MPANKLKKFTAKHRKTGTVAEFTYYSIKQAQLLNPGWIEWKEVKV